MIWRLSWDIDALITIVIFWIVGMVLLFMVPRNRKPSSATAWLLLMYIVPVVGIIVFLLIGSPKLTKRRRAMQSTMNETISKAVDEAQSQQASPDRERETASKPAHRRRPGGGRHRGR